MLVVWHEQASPPTYLTTNWRACNAALKQRGSLQIWFGPQRVWLADARARHQPAGSFVFLGALADLGIELPDLPVKARDDFEPHPQCRHGLFRQAVCRILNDGNEARDIRCPLGHNLTELGHAPQRHPARYPALRQGVLEALDRIPHRSRIEAKMRCLRAFRERIAARDPDRQTAEIQIRVDLMNRFNALGTAEIIRVA